MNKVNEKSIVLIGFMGVGKSTVGQILANQLKRDFIDTDKEIEKQYQMPVTKIFETFGEATFRKKEKELITDLCQQKQKIISVGGGAFLQPEIRQICLEQTIVIYLDISWKVWRERLDILIATRPVLQGRSLEEIEELFYKRKEFYSEHHIKILTDHLSPEKIVENIMRSI